MTLQSVNYSKKSRSFSFSSVNIFLISLRASTLDVLKLFAHY
uniref:Uncharacterized protein n=1 Tax=Lepeophtheirus salmonis TaxID=72036 RepID=A0A0K2VHW3_LEPSM